MNLHAEHLQIKFRVDYLAQVVTIHVFSLVAFVYFWSFQALLIAAGLGLLTGHMIGIFYHMRLTHNSFQCPRWFERAGVLIGALSWRGPFALPIRWAAIHRVHHAHSDSVFDVHSPTRGFAYAVLGWFWRMPRGFSEFEIYQSYVPNSLSSDRFYLWLENYTHWLQLAWGLVCFVTGGVLGTSTPFDLANAMRFVLYGVFVKTLAVLWAGNILDILNHSWGYRNYETHDLSKNSRLLAVIFLGGVLSWHNNHHAYPAAFRVRKRWWELDGHYTFLKLLEPLGLSWDIRIQDDFKIKTTEKGI